MACLLEVALDGGARGGAVLHCIAEGEAGKGVKVACFDGCKQVEGTGLSAEAWWRWTVALMLGRLHVLVAWGDDVGVGKGWVWAG